MMQFIEKVIAYILVFIAVFYFVFCFSGIDAKAAVSLGGVSWVSDTSHKSYSFNFTVDSDDCVTTGTNNRWDYRMPFTFHFVHTFSSSGAVDILSYDVTDLFCSFSHSLSSTSSMISFEELTYDYAMTIGSRTYDMYYFGNNTPISDITINTHDCNDFKVSVDVTVNCYVVFSDFYMPADDFTTLVGTIYSDLEMLDWNQTEGSDSFSILSEQISNIPGGVDNTALLEEGNQLQEQGNQLQEQGNQLQEQGNQLQEQQNQLQEDANLLQQDANELSEQQNQLQEENNALQSAANQMTQGVIDDASAAFSDTNQLGETTLSDYDAQISFFNEQGELDLDNIDYAQADVSGAHFSGIFVTGSAWVGQMLAEIYEICGFQQIFVVSSTLLAGIIIIGYKKFWR